MLTGCSLNTKQKLNGQVFLSVIFLWWKLFKLKPAVLKGKVSDDYRTD